MAITMKGFRKGLRYISQLFDEEEQIEQEIEIGLPTDVKHVAHIGADGPSAFNTPSWVKEFQPQSGFESTVIGSLGNDIKNSGIKVSSAADSRSSNIVQNSILPKPTTNGCLVDKSGCMLPKKKESKSKQTKKKSSKEGDPSQNLPKKSRRKKSKELVSVGAPSKLRLKSDMPN